VSTSSNSRLGGSLGWLARQRIQLGHDPVLLGSSGLPQRGNVIQPSGCEERATLGTQIQTIINPNGVVANRNATVGVTPLEMSAKGDVFEIGRLRRQREVAQIDL